MNRLYLPMRKVQSDFLPNAIRRPIHDGSKQSSRSVGQSMSPYFAQAATLVAVFLCPRL
jgi:hypothetical protein